ncbi:MAG TPA: hypothetical protein VF089_20815, partial [Candidatus Binatia bacterium]
MIKLLAVTGKKLTIPKLTTNGCERPRFDTVRRKRRILGSTSISFAVYLEEIRDLGSQGSMIREIERWSTAPRIAKAI